MTTDLVSLAGKWIDEAEGILICAGAGMSAHDGTNVYVSETDFKNHYAPIVQYGYDTSYDAMGLMFDQSVPLAVRWGYQASHINNQRYRYSPPPAYTTLLSLCEKKDTFVITSNVDGYFERAGFDKDRIYTPQGDWEWYQCLKPCTQTVYPSKPMIDRVLPHIDPNTLKISSNEFIPKCPNCKGDVFGNVRGGDWFIHNHLLQAQNNFIQFVEKYQKEQKKLLVIEIGAGFNTPVVTRFPMESIVRKNINSHLIRINPSSPEVPTDISAIGIPKGTEILSEIKKFLEKKEKKELNEEEELTEEKINKIMELIRKSNSNPRLRQNFCPTEWNWKKLIENLK